MYFFVCVTDVVGSQRVPFMSHWSTEWPFQTPASIQMASHFLVSDLLRRDMS